MKGLWIFALMFAVSPLLSAQDDNPSARAEILGLERAWNQAYKNGDAQAIVGLFDDSLVVIEGDGGMKTKFQYLASVKKHSIGQEQISLESVKVNVYGKTAVAIGEISVKGMQSGKPSMHRERFIDTWINKNNTWVLVASDSTPIP
jgi:ketosteroid isomerase-like protein